MFENRSFMSKKYMKLKLLPLLFFEYKFNAKMNDTIKNSFIRLLEKSTALLIFPTVLYSYKHYFLKIPLYF